MSGIRCPICDYDLFDCNCEERFGEKLNREFYGEGEWRPIETAPCNDTLAFVLFGNDNKAAPYPFNVYPEDLDHDSTPEWWKERGATHWMPIPKPPEE